MQWLSLLVPLIAIAVGFWKFKKSLVWWEYLLVFSVPALFVFTSTAIIENNIPKSTSVNSFFSTKAQYDEHWDEWIKKTCSEQYACGTESYSYSCGSGKTRSTCRGSRTKYCTRYYDCSYREDHPAKWGYYLSDGGYISVSPQEFEKMCVDWKNRKFVEMNRHFYRIDGDRYECDWNGDTMAVRHNSKPVEYENRLLATKNIMGFREIDSIDIARYGLLKNPSDEFSSTESYPFILGYAGSDYPTAYQYLAGVNSILGAKMQMAMLIVVYHDKPSDVCEMHEAYWKGGKKNELILCINERDGKVANSKVISWTKNELLKVKVRDSLASVGKFDILQSAKILKHFSETMWSRRSFSEFDYIEVKMELKPWHHVLIWVLVILISSGIGYWVVVNDVSPKNKNDW